ncbi:MAG: acetyl-CoA carboxylase, biotin carboxyl carrier protein [Clostridiales bacterium]|jgi:acetyl-CoA carboxylase biotin carboxyl carrier protein|nr:acetyl-CoA carboxylase, biotin carboxyl carrier protein [Clostridiales bacterium]
MELTEKIKVLSQTMRANSIKLLEFKNRDEEIRIELFPETEPPCRESQESETLESKTLPIEDSDTIQAPIMGVAYTAPYEKAGNFVEIGDRVKKGDVLCIIEAMKVMNEVTADSDYEVLEICFENGQIIEYGQDLFKIKRIEAPDVQ